MKLSEVLEEIGLPEARELFAPHWEQSVSSYPDGGPFFLAERELADYCKAGCFPDGYLTPLCALAAEIRGRRAWSLFVWHLHRLLFFEPEYPRNLIEHWPYPVKTLGERAGLVFMPPFLGSIRLIRECHRKMGVPEDVTRETLPNLAGNTSGYEQKNGGRPGITTRTLYWVRNHVAGELFRLGRLEFRVQGFPSYVHVFRESNNGRVLALLSDGLEYNDEGLIDDDSIKQPDRDYRRARLDRGGSVIRGVPVPPTGRALVDREVKLPAADWKPVLKPGDPVLDIHIPAGGGMTVEALRDSMSRALDFFPRYRPDRPFTAFASQSWIFNTDLEDMLPADSNLIKFQRQVYLYPHRTNGKAGLYFIFGENDPDPDSAPRNTSLQRAFIPKLRSGRGSRNGAMFLLPEDLEYFGSEYYRKQTLGDLFSQP